jgi:oligoendopeptidase F
MSSYHQYGNTLAATLTGACRKAHFDATAHRYPGVIAAALDEDNIPVAFYDSLLSTVHKHLPALHRYLTLKQKALQVPELHAYDLYIPISQATDTYKFTFTEACDFISKALAPLGATYGQVLQHAFTPPLIDRYENRGKRSGAYSWGIYGLHPYVLMSYQPGYRSMSTIAHELGHSLHSYFTNQTQPYATSDYTIFCAEIASTTNEILLSEYALAQLTRTRNCSCSTRSWKTSGPRFTGSCSLQNLKIYPYQDWPGRIFTGAGSGYVLAQEQRYLLRTGPDHGPGPGR